MNASPRRRSLRAKLLLLCASVVVALGIAEFALRVLDIPPVHTPRMALYNFRMLPGLDGAWEIPPGSEVRFQWDGDPYGRLPLHAHMVATVNEHGLRGPAPPQGEPTTLFLGDSFTFGEGVEDEQTFVRRVEASLGPDAGSCVNAGVPGFGTVHQAARLPDWLRTFQPQAVVLVFVLNDPVPADDVALRDNDLTRTSGESTARFRIASLFQRLRSSRDTVRWYESYYTGDRAQEWVRSRAALAEIHALCEAADTPLGVALFPLLYQVSDSPFAPLHEMVETTCGDLGIPYLDLTAALAAEAESELWVHPTDHHPNARAHELVAEPLSAFVRELRQR